MSEDQEKLQLEDEKRIGVYTACSTLIFASAGFCILAIFVLWYFFVR
jgi:hypothetical protein